MGTLMRPHKRETNDKYKNELNVRNYINTQYNKLDTYAVRRMPCLYAWWWWQIHAAAVVFFCVYNPAHTHSPKQRFPLLIWRSLQCIYATHFTRTKRRKWITKKLEIVTNERHRIECKHAAAAAIAKRCTDWNIRYKHISHRDTVSFPHRTSRFRLLPAPFSGYIESQGRSKQN